MSDFQLPLLQELPDDVIDLTLNSISPIELLDAPPPTPAFIENIARRGVPTIVVCPETRCKHGLFYPMDGKRRMLALYALAEAGHIFGDVHAREYVFNAEVYYDYTPETAQALRMSFEANHHRSQNIITDVKAIQAMAKFLKVDILSADGQKAVAKELNVPYQTVKKLCKGLRLKPIHHQALYDGLLSPAGLKVIMDLENPDDHKDIIKRLKKDEMLSVNDLRQYSKAQVQQALGASVANQQDVPVMFYTEDNPLESALEILQGMKQTEKVIAVIELLKGLL